MKPRQIYCPHYVKSSKKTSVYTYKLINAELNLCNACEKRLRKEMFEQYKIEKDMKKEVYKKCQKVKADIVSSRI